MSRTESLKTDRKTFTSAVSGSRRAGEDIMILSAVKSGTVACAKTQLDGTF